MVEKKKFFRRKKSKSKPKPFYFSITPTTPCRSILSRVRRQRLLLGEKNIFSERSRKVNQKVYFFEYPSPVRPSCKSILSKSEARVGIHFSKFIGLLKRKHFAKQSSLYADYDEKVVSTFNRSTFSPILFTRRHETFER